MSVQNAGLDMQPRALRNRRAVMRQKLRGAIEGPYDAVPFGQGIVLYSTYSAHSALLDTPTPLFCQSMVSGPA